MYKILLTVFILFGTKEILAQVGHNTLQYKGDTSTIGLTTSEKKSYSDYIKCIEKYVEAYPVLSNFNFFFMSDPIFLGGFEKAVFGEDFMYTDAIGDVCIKKSYLTQTNNIDYFSFFLCRNLFYASHQAFSDKHQSLGQNMILKVRTDFPDDTIASIKFLINFKGFIMIPQGFSLVSSQPYGFVDVEKDAADYLGRMLCKKVNDRLDIRILYGSLYGSTYNLFDALENQNSITPEILAEYGKYSDLSRFIYDVLQLRYQEFFDKYYSSFMTDYGCSIVLKHVN